MKLYYFSGACSLASNIALREAGLPFELVKVDRRTRKATDGLDFGEVNPKGYVPALALDNGEVLTAVVSRRRAGGDQAVRAQGPQRETRVSESRHRQPALSHG